MAQDYYRIKTITSHAGYARWLAEVREEPVREIPRIKEIPSPYASSPTDTVLRWGTKDVVVREVRHKRYEVFELKEARQ